jgi:CheY-like chemotaxis protein
MSSSRDNKDIIPALEEKPMPECTVLYIEDNPANMMVVEQLIARCGDLKFLMAVCGRIGIQMAKEHYPDVIVMDINLPDMNGFDVLKVLRDDPALIHIPVMALSSDAYPRQIEKGIQAGFFRYLTKPFKIDDFMLAIGMMLQHVAKNENMNR